MSIESRSRQYGKVFDHWQIREFLGSGSGGKSAVFRLVHTSSNSVQSALKVISLIEQRGTMENLSSSRKAEYESIKKKCKECAEQEVLLMNGLQGRTNIVDYLDHTFIDWADESGFGCDMLIRMELLTDLRRELENERVFMEEDVLKIGRDICTALVLCHSKHILHRDIKPENIFFNQDGNYKLGDFGVSRILSAAPMSKASTGVCTPEYAAPEQLSGKYDNRVDIYSLGLVLYELINNNRLPFASSVYVTETDVKKRMNSNHLPKPANASDAFTTVILKACAHKPEDRYQTASDMLHAISEIIENANHAAFTEDIHKEDAAPNNSGTKESGKNQKFETEPATASKKNKSTAYKTVFAGSVKKPITKKSNHSAKIKKNLQSRIHSLSLFVIIVSIIELLLMGCFTIFGIPTWGWIIYTFIIDLIMVIIIVIKIIKKSPPNPKKYDRLCFVALIWGISSLIMFSYMVTFTTLPLWIQIVGIFGSSIRFSTALCLCGTEDPNDAQTSRKTNIIEVVVFSILISLVGVIMATLEILLPRIFN